jgi:hypothetical protein
LLNKLIISALVISSVSACHNGKKDETQIISSVETAHTDGASDSSENGAVALQMNYTGVVRDMSKAEGCGWMIQIEEEDGTKLFLEPLSLPAEYQVEGKVIEFAYTNSRRQSTCTTIPSRPITIDNILN